MNELKFVVTDGDPSSKDFKTLSDGLLSHHASKGHPKTWKKFSIFLRDEQNVPHAGVIVTFMWNGMHIDSLWVDESLRGNDYGITLMKMVETEAIKRGCTVAYTDTFTWQAPKFYEKLGYTIYGKLKDFPEGNTLYYYSKELK